MGVEKECLTETQYQQLLEAAYNYDKTEVLPKVIQILRWTGMHISCLCNSDTVKAEHLRTKSKIWDYGLEIIKLDNLLYFRWKRTKKEGKEAIITVPVSKAITFQSELKEFIKKIITRKRKSNRNYYWRQFKIIGKRGGYPTFSPMNLRHTFGVTMTEMGYPDDMIMERMGCSVKVLRTYKKIGQAKAKNIDEKIGWT